MPSRNGWVPLGLTIVGIAVALLLSVAFDGGWRWQLIIPAVVIAAISAFSWRVARRP
ncbi:hypothetical protein [uncultured Jatrophihabitans sp.]|uniref:hypothetical protein n=1 Tax=uncultured Jatrophihabitans sp. TaxID=1610747 RepID=UPI0035CA8EA2